jgi:isoleucyl-tRNA synthetase
MRHGEAESNVAGILSSHAENQHHLTENGKAHVMKSAETLKGKKIDLILTSPFVRTRETAEIVRATLGLPDSAVILEERLHEVNVGVLEGTPTKEYRKKISFVEHMHSAPEGGETLEEVGQRMVSVLFDLEKQYAGKNILIVSHGTPLFMLDGYAHFLDQERIIAERLKEEEVPIAPGSWSELPFFAYPHRANGEPDLHRPYIDQVELIDEDGTPLNRVPEVVDGWVESGSMPFAANHYPFENEKEFDDHFPGDFIAEYIAQTRTWFYYMHVMGVELFNSAAFKTVVSTGTILAADGSKMSKSKGNYTDPFQNFDRFGADALRAYLMGSVVMQAEDLRFTDDDLREVHNRFIGILWNTYQFYALQKGDYVPEAVLEKSPHVLDRWILARLAGTGQEVTKGLDLSDTVRATRALKEFTLDLSTWYIRRSRDRLKGDDAADRSDALRTTTEVFLTLSKYLAPLTPFLAEMIYRGVGGPLQSVHLESWPETRLVDSELVMRMGVTRAIVSKALEAHVEAGLKIRQPLQKLTIRDERLIEQTPYLSLIAEELNVKEVLIDPNQAEEVVLDTELSDELIEEGAVREFGRLLQQNRKDMGLMPGDMVRVLVDSDQNGQEFIMRHKDEFKKTAGISDLDIVPLDEGAATALIYGTSIRFAILPPQG